MMNPTKHPVTAIVICMAVLLCFASLVSAQITLVKVEASANQPRLGDTLTVNIKISNAQSVYGLDVTLNWNASVLRLISATPNLGVESHSDGVLHESSNYPIDILDNTPSSSSGTYHLLATSTGASTPTFSGSGTIAILTFNVTNSGESGLALSDVELSVVNGEDIELVSPQTQVTSVNVPVPEFPMIAVVAVAAVAVAAMVTVS